MCAPRVQAGKPTACAEACPTGATKFGDRDELLKEAQQRIQANPDKYLHHIYGETEVGGTSVMLLSSVDFQNFGYRDDLTQRALPMYTYQVLQHIPQFVPLFGTLLGGIYWITHRREDVAEAEENEQERRQAMALRDIPIPKMRFTFWKAVFLVIMVAGIYCTYVRFFQGLGASTNLSDQFPWGLWIGFDVMCGVMLAAGGFTLTAAVEIFNIKRWHSIMRPTVLTAFMGYLLVCAALMYDLGLPWNIWHPLIMRNPHSVMFEVAYCVMLYTTVLALEFSPIVFERLGWKRALSVVRSVMIMFVILGVMLSTLAPVFAGHAVSYHAQQAASFLVQPTVAGVLLHLGHRRWFGDDHLRVVDEFQVLRARDELPILQ